MTATHQSESGNQSLLAGFVLQNVRLVVDADVTQVGRHVNAQRHRPQEGARLEARRHRDVLVTVLNLLFEVTDGKKSKII